MMTDSGSGPGAIVITGASSGLGRALALAYARPGTRLFLAARDPDRLDAVAAEVRRQGAQASTRQLDVGDRDRVSDWIGACGPLQLVIANAGISAGTGAGVFEPAHQVRALFRTNLDGALNTALPALRIMAGQPAISVPGFRQGLRGRIAVVASIAAFVPAPGAPSYCASKAALHSWALATAPTARRMGIHLASVCPGYIRTAMTADNPFPMPGLMNADRAAALIQRGIQAGRMQIAFPLRVMLGARLIGLLPPAIAARLLSRTAGKPAYL